MVADEVVWVVVFGDDVETTVPDWDGLLPHRAFAGSTTGVYVGIALAVTLEQTGGVLGGES